MRLAPLSDPFPFSEHVYQVVHVDAIRPQSVGHVVGTRIEVTMHASAPYREYIPGPTLVYGRDGELIAEASWELISAALRGGGDFAWLADNGAHDVQTLEEFLGESRA